MDEGKWRLDHLSCDAADEEHGCRPGKRAAPLSVERLSSFRDRLLMQIRLAFERESVPALVILHGQRIICASALSSEIEADSHLISGPCVLPEYCNRGFGTALLHASLVQLAQSGIPSGYAISKEGVPATKFLYPKFGSTQRPCEYETAMAVE